MRSASFSMINKCAKKYASQCNRSPYMGLIRALTGDAQENWTEALIFLNCLIVRCPSNKRRAQFLARLQNLGINNELRKIAANPESIATVMKQLVNVQINFKEILPSTQFLISIHKNRVEQLE